MEALFHFLTCSSSKSQSRKEMRGRKIHRDALCTNESTFIPRRERTRERERGSEPRKAHSGGPRMKSSPPFSCFHFSSKRPSVHITEVIIARARAKYRAREENRKRAEDKGTRVGERTRNINRRGMSECILALLKKRERSEALFAQTTMRAHGGYEFVARALIYSRSHRRDLKGRRSKRFAAARTFSETREERERDREARRR